MKKFDQQAQMFGKLSPEVELKRGNARGALEHFNAARKSSTPGSAGMPGRAYLKAAEYTDAQTEFDACLGERASDDIPIDDLPTYRVMASARYYMGLRGKPEQSAAKAAALESYKRLWRLKRKATSRAWWPMPAAVSLR
jgi:hypothetical protein